MAVCLARPGDQLHADRACTYGTVAVSDSGWSLSVLWVELRLFVVVVLYTWRATVCYRTWQSSNRAVYSRNCWTFRKSTVRRRPTVRVVKRLSRRRLDWLQAAVGHNFVGMPKPQSRLPRDGRRHNGRRSVTAGNVSDSSCTTKPTVQIESKSREVIVIINSLHKFR